MFFKYKVSVIFQCMKYNTIITASKIPWFPIEFCIALFKRSIEVSKFPVIVCPPYRIINRIRVNTCLWIII